MIREGERYRGGWLGMFSKHGQRGREGLWRVGVRKVEC